MYISINWIKDFVDLDGIDIKGLINKFTLSTAEVEGIIEYGKDTTGVIAAKILEVEKHPESEKISVLKVDTGNGILQSLCSAPNVAVGLVIPFAPAGTKVCGKDITKVEMLGKTSEGVCLSEKELGISDDHSGLMILDENIKIGTSIKELIDIDDVIFEVDNKSLTNRPDLWGHYGIAREIAAITGRSLRPLEKDDLETYNSLPKLDIKVEDEEKCYRYSSIAIENITKKVSPINMRIRLYYCGTRAINLLADVTNYIMLELGQPMHAFDKALVNKVNIKTLGQKRNFKTLDGEIREVYEDTLMICKDDEPICIAGIMGGENTQINENTNSLFLESANFDSTSIRKSATKIGLRTEASTRYEKTLDPELTRLAIERYIKLLKDVDQGIQIVSSFTDVYVKKYPQIDLEITEEYVNRRMGIELSIEKMQEILVALGFEVERTEDTLKVKVPSYRATKDVSIKADLVEEIARVYGYDNIPPKTKLDALKIVKDDEERINDNIIKNTLAEKFGASEVHTYIWYDKKKNAELKIKTDDNIKIINSLNADNNVLRQSMMPALLNVVNENAKYYNTLSVFEIGRTFEYENKNEDCKEIKKLGYIIATREATIEKVMEEAQKAINAICLLTKNFIPTIKNVETSKYSWTMNPNMGNITYNDKVLGYISELNLITKNQIDKKMNIVIVELDLDVLNSIEKLPKVYKKISKYQTVEVDLSLLVNQDMPYATIEKYIQEMQIENIQEHTLIDVFEDEKVLKDKKSLTIRFVLGSFDHTLTSEEINISTEKIITYFANKGIELRK